MPHILLVPYHPHEMEVVSYLAQKLKANLEQRGHKVDIVPVPEEISLYGEARKAIAQRKQKSSMDLEEAALVFQERLLAMHPDAFLISVHTGPVGEQQLKKKPSKWKVRETWLYEDAYNHPDIWIAEDPHKKNPRVFYLEARAVVVPAPTPLHSLSRALLPESMFYAGRFKSRHDLKKTLGRNIINPQMIRRIGHLVDTKVMQAAGKYKRVLSGLYATKKKWTRKNKPRRQQEQRWKLVRPHK